jgi:hypothetical protein
MTKTKFGNTDVLWGKDYKKMYKELEKKNDTDELLERMYRAHGKEKLENENLKFDQENRNLKTKLKILEAKLIPLESNLNQAIEEAKRHEMQHLQTQLTNARREGAEYKKEWIQYKKQLEQLQTQAGSDGQLKLTIEKVLDMPANWNYYDVLGIADNTDPLEIARVFTKLKSPLWHPDKWSKYSPTLQHIAGHVFKLLQEAKDKLCADPQYKIPDSRRRMTWSLQHVTTDSIFTNPYTVF